METCNKFKNKEKIKLKFATQQKYGKAKFLQKMMVYDDVSKKCHVLFKKLSVFLKVFELLYVYQV